MCNIKSVYYKNYKLLKLNLNRVRKYLNRYCNIVI